MENEKTNAELIEEIRELQEKNAALTEALAFKETALREMQDDCNVVRAAYEATIVEVHAVQASYRAVRERIDELMKSYQEEMGRLIAKEQEE